MPQNKTKKSRRKLKQHKYSNSRPHNYSQQTQFKSIFDRTPTPYPYSNYSTIYSNSPSSVAPQISQNPQYLSSSAYVKAVSNNGKQWHVDMDINGLKKHGNLTNSQIMELLSYPASKQNMQSQLLNHLRNIPNLPLNEPLMKPNFSFPIAELYHSQEEPRIRYIYKKGCAAEPMMMNNLSPLQEASIVPEFDKPSIHLIPMKRSSSSNTSSKKYKNKIKSKKKKQRKNK